MEMLEQKRFIFQMFIVLIFSVTVVPVFAQSEGGKQSAAPQNERLPLEKLKNPILFSVRTGPFVLADLVGPDPEDTDAVLVEVKGVRLSFKLDEVRIRAQALKYDEFGKVGRNDEKGRLDNYAIRLQNDPKTSAYVIVYGSCLDEGRNRATRIKDYLVNTRGLDGSRVVTLDNTCRPEMLVQLWVVPIGVDPPTNSEATLDRCRPCLKSKQKRRSRSRRRS